MSASANPHSALRPQRVAGHILEHLCPECGSEMILRPSRFGLFYGCVRFPACTATHGAHADGMPKGIPADHPTRQSRIRAHAAFDRMWRSLGWSRRAGYRWLRNAMGLSVEDAHIARFNSRQCDRVVSAVAAEMDLQVTGAGWKPKTRADWERAKAVRK